MPLKAFLGHILLRCFNLLLILLIHLLLLKGAIEGTTPFMIQQSDFLYEQAIATYDMPALEQEHNVAIIKYMASETNLIRIQHLLESPEQIKTYNSKPIWPTIIQM